MSDYFFFSVQFVSDIPLLFLAHCLSHCKGTTFCWIIFNILCLLVALSFLDIIPRHEMRSKRIYL